MWGPAGEMAQRQGEDVVSIWGKVIGGVAGFALGGPLGALFGAFAGHAYDKMRRGGRRRDADPIEGRRVAFTIAIIVLSAKMAKVDGHVTRDEIDAFKRVFNVPPHEMKNVGGLFDEARRDARGFEPYAEQIAHLFAAQPAVLEELLGGLFLIAKADGKVKPAELDYLRRVASILGFDPHHFERIRVSHMSPEEADPYEVLGLARSTPGPEIKKAYRRLIRENHPDTLIAQGMPQEFIDLANDRMATINVAYDRVATERGLS